MKTSNAKTTGGIINDYCSNAYAQLDVMVKEDLPFVTSILGFDLKNTLKGNTLYPSSAYFEIQKMVNNAESYDRVAITALNIYAKKAGKRLVSFSMLDDDNDFFGIYDFTVFDSE